MMNGIEIFDPIDKSKLSQKDYFSSLMSEAVDTCLVSNAQSEKIQGEIFEILSELCMAIAQKGHSSISSETAQNIVKSIMYCIGLKLKEFEKPKMAVEYVLENKLFDIYYQGREIISNQLEQMKEKAEKARKNLFKTENIFYAASITDEVEKFFENYDAKYAADKANVVFDYCVYGENENLCGIEMAYDFVERFYHENNFLLLFDERDVHHLLSSIEIEGELNIYQNLLISIFEPVFASAIGLVLVGKSPLNLDLTQSDIKKIEEIFLGKSKSEISKTLIKATNELVYLLKIDAESEKYLSSVLKTFEDAIFNSKTLENLFLVPSYPEFSQSISIEDQEQMSQAEFRSLSQLLKSCNMLKRKVEFICENIKSQRDFDDLIYAVPLNSDEIFWSLKRLSPTIALLMYAQYKTEDESEAKKAIEKYVSELSKPRQELIKKLASKIQ